MIIIPPTFLFSLYHRIALALHLNLEALSIRREGP